jgi:hypothetical protein
MACNTTYAASTRTAFVDIDIDPKQLVLVGAQARALHEGGSDSLLLLLYPLLHSPALEQFFSSTFRFQTHNHYLTTSQRLSPLPYPPQNSSSARPPSCTISHTTQKDTTMSPPTTTTIPITLSISSPRPDTCPNAQPEIVSTHALNNAIQVLEFTLLTFVVLRLLARYASIGALVGLSLIIGGFLYDIGVGFPGVDAATTTTILESTVECAASGRSHSTTLWILSAALAVFMLLALIIDHRRRSMPRHSSLTTSYRPLVGRMLVIDKPITSSAEGVRVRDHPLNSMTIITTTGNSIARHHLIRTKLAGTLLGLIFLAILLPLALAADPQVNFEVAGRSAQGGDDVSPIWITYYSTTTTWLPAVTVTAPPVLNSSPMPTGSMDGTAAGTDGLGSSMPGGSWLSVHVCTEVEQAVCPIVEGRKTGVPHASVA